MNKYGIFLITVSVLAACSSQEKDDVAGNVTGAQYSNKSKKPDEIQELTPPEDPNWINRYSPEIPYYNRSSNAIPAKATANPQSKVTGMIQPGEGGFVLTCVLDSTYCEITFGGNGMKGYVDMETMLGEAR